MPVRNPFSVMDALHKCMCHQKSKDMRVCQVISNALSLHLGQRFANDIFYVEDDVMVEALYGYLSWLNKE